MNNGIESRLAALGASSAEVEERFIRGSGKGGQKINKTSSCVVLLHRPTGLAARCQRERSQVLNRELAWQELCSKLEKRQRAARAAQQDEAQRARRRVRQKSGRQKARMVASKLHRADIKKTRGRIADE
jgi:protein subunit release factor B